MRFRESQKQRTLFHPNLPQEEGRRNNSRRRRVCSTSEHSFVVCADTQFGMSNNNVDWDTELEYSQRAIEQINALEPRPAFCCCCGDLVNMEYGIYGKKTERTKEECNLIQDEQNQDFVKMWSRLHDDIALVCICGNHDVGNRPSSESIERFENVFGDDHLAFWANGTYNIVLNTSLISDSSGAPHLFDQQFEWLKEKLDYASKNDAAAIFVFGHHPWFLYSDDEDNESMKGYIPYPEDWNRGEGGFPDYYFHIPKSIRSNFLTLFEKYHVDAAFAGHFHQNVKARASFGMEMITTSSLSLVFDSNGKPPQDEPLSRGIRIVHVNVPVKGRATYRHKFEPLTSCSDVGISGTDSVLR